MTLPEGMPEALGPLDKPEEVVWAGPADQPIVAERAMYWGTPSAADPTTPAPPPAMAGPHQPADPRTERCTADRRSCIKVVVGCAWILVGGHGFPRSISWC